MSDRYERLVSGYGHHNPASPAQLKEARKQRDAAARFQERPDFELALRWRDAGDPRYTALPAQTKIAIGSYMNDKAAHEGMDR